MKNTGLLLFLLCAFSGLHAQQYKPQETRGMDYRKRMVGPRSTDVVTACLEFNGKVYAVATRYLLGRSKTANFYTGSELCKDVVLYELNKSMAVVRTIKIPLTVPTMKKRITMLQYEKCGNKLLAFFTYFNLKTRKTYLFCSSIDVERAKTVTRKLGEYDNRSGGAFRISVNPEKTQFRILTIRYQARILARKTAKNRKSKRSYLVGEDPMQKDPLNTLLGATYDADFNLISSRPALQLETTAEAVLRAVAYTANGHLVAVTSNDKPASGDSRNILHIYTNKNTLRLPLPAEDSIYSHYSILPGKAVDSILELVVVRNTNSWQACRAEVYRFHCHNGALLHSTPFPEGILKVNDVSETYNGRPNMRLRDTVKKKFHIASCHAHPDGSYSLLLERNKHWWEQYTTRTSNGTQVTSYKEHHQYGPAVFAQWNPGTGVFQHTRVLYEDLYIDQYPNQEVSSYYYDSTCKAVLTNTSIALIQPGDTVVTPKRYKLKGMKRLPWSTRIFPLDDRFIMFSQPRVKRAYFTEIRMVQASGDRPKRKSGK